MTPAQTFRQFTQALDPWWPPAGRGQRAPRAFIGPMSLLASAVGWDGILEGFAQHCAGGVRHA